MCRCIIIAEDDMRAARIIEARLSAWGLNAVTAPNCDRLRTLLQRYPQALACHPRRWLNPPAHPMVACLRQLVAAERMLAYDSDLWATGCPERLRRLCAGALDWAVHHG